MPAIKFSLYEFNRTLKEVNNYFEKFVLEFLLSLVIILIELIMSKVYNNVDKSGEEFTSKQSKILILKKVQNFYLVLHLFRNKQLFYFLV